MTGGWGREGKEPLPAGGALCPYTRPSGSLHPKCELPQLPSCDLSPPCPGGAVCSGPSSLSSEGLWTSTHLGGRWAPSAHGSPPAPGRLDRLSRTVCREGRRKAVAGDQRVVAALQVSAWCRIPQRGAWTRCQRSLPSPSSRQQGKDPRASSPPCRSVPISLGAAVSRSNSHIPQPEDRTLSPKSHPTDYAGHMENLALRAPSPTKTPEACQPGTGRAAGARRVPLCGLLSHSSATRGFSGRVGQRGAARAAPPARHSL